jgi:hypothetical protein
MILLNPLGRCFKLSAADWHLALAAARENGWKPTGTLAPPVALSSGKPQRWQGDYQTPAGQEISRPDARCLARALARADPRIFLNLIRFFRQNGALLCALEDQ